MCSDEKIPRGNISLEQFGKQIPCILRCSTVGIQLEEKVAQITIGVESMSDDFTMDGFSMWQRFRVAKRSKEESICRRIMRTAGCFAMISGRKHSEQIVYGYGARDVSTAATCLRG